VWFLSGVVVAGITTFATYFHNHLQKKQEDERRLKYLKYEFGSRYMNLYYATNHQKFVVQQKILQGERFYRELLFVPTDDFKPMSIFPENRGIALEGLMLELEFIAQNDETRRELRDLRLALHRLQESFTYPEEDKDKRAEFLATRVSEFSVQWRNALDKLKFRGDLSDFGSDFKPDFEESEP
jgi:hypothetical protein